MEPKKYSDEALQILYGILEKALVPLELYHDTGKPVYVWHSKYAGDIDYSAVVGFDDEAPARIVHYTLVKIVNAAREDGRRSAQSEMKRAMGL